MENVQVLNCLLSQKVTNVGFCSFSKVMQHVIINNKAGLVPSVWKINWKPTNLSQLSRRWSGTTWCTSRPYAAKWACGNPWAILFQVFLFWVVVLSSAYSEVMMGQFSRSQWSKSTQWTTGSTWWFVRGIISLQLVFGCFSSEKSLRLYSVLSVCTLLSLRDNKTCDTSNTWDLSKKFANTVMFLSYLSWCC